jgi:methionine-gamma-lyase
LLVAPGQQAGDAESAARRNSMKHHAHGIGTLAVHAGALHNDVFGAHVQPIYQTSTFCFESVRQAADRFAGKEKGHIYTRLGNPTIQHLQRKVAALEGKDLIAEATSTGTDVTVQALAFSSGLAAIGNTVLALVRPGEPLIVQDVLYGGTTELLLDVLPRHGVRSEFVEPSVPANLAAALERTGAKAVLIETPANPTLKICDIATLARECHEHDAVLIVDNTFATPILQRPLSLGADIVVHSCTKYLGGHGLVVGGIAVSPHVEFMATLYQYVKQLGSCPSPFDSWLVLQGIKTLHLRMQAHSRNGRLIAGFLAQHPKVAAVYYPGLEGFEGHELASRQMEDFGGMLAFELKGGFGAGVTLMESVEVCSLAVSLGTVDTLIQHPASMTHAAVPREKREQFGISDGLVRISAGVEDGDDIVADLEKALSKL